MNTKPMPTIILDRKTHILFQRPNSKLIESGTIIKFNKGKMIYEVDLKNGYMTHVDTSSIVCYG